MVEYDTFRQDLANSLLRCAERRRLSRAGGTPTGEDIKVIALLEWLAADVRNLDLHVFLIFELMFTHKRLARRYLRQHDDLLEQLGVLYCPASATELVRWLTNHTLYEASDGRAPSLHCRPALDVLPHPGRLALGRGDTVDGSKEGILLSSAVNFAAGFGIVAPCLSLWNVWTAFRQMNDRAFIANHASVQAAVVSISPVTPSRSSGTASDVVLTFKQSSGEFCTATWHTGMPAFSGAPGDTVMVVPRSPSCDLPLIPSAVGDPMQTFAIAAALMAGGLASIKLWDWLSPRSARQVSQSRPLATGDRRHDLA